MKTSAVVLAAALLAAACGGPQIMPTVTRPPATTVPPVTEPAATLPPSTLPPPTTPPPPTTLPPAPATVPPATTLPPERESYVSEAAARRVIEDFLDAVAAAEWEIAAGYLWNEGVSPEIERRLGPVWERTPEELFTAFCSEAACDAHYDIGPTVAFDEWSRTVRVEFATSRGIVPVDVRAGMFEGIVTLGALPPPGRAGQPVVPTDERVLGERYPGGFTVIRYAAVERDGTWSRWWPARWGGRLEATGDWVAQQWEGSPLHIGRLPAGSPDGAEQYETTAALVGAGRLDGAPVFLIADGGRLDALDPATRRVVELVDLATVTVLGADVAGNRLAVTVAGGGDVRVEVYTLDGAAVRDEPPTVLAPAGATGTASFSPGGVRLAVPTGPRVGAADGVVLVDAVGGTELGRWRHDGPESVLRVDYDGRFIVAQLGRDEAYGLLVIDVPGGATRELATGLQVRFS